MPTHTFVALLRKYGNKNQCVNGILEENYPIKNFLQLFIDIKFV